MKSGARRSSTLLCLVCQALACAGCGGRDEQGPRLRMAFRIAADPSADRGVVAQARATKGHAVERDGACLARWVAVREEIAPGLAAETGCVTRTTAEGRVELLVLVTGADVNDSHVQELRLERDRYGKPEIEVTANEEGERVMRILSQENRGRRLAEIIDGEVFAAPVIHAPIYDRWRVGGPYPPRLLKTIIARHRAE